MLRNYETSFLLLPIRDESFMTYLGSEYCIRKGALLHMTTKGKMQRKWFMDGSKSEQDMVLTEASSLYHTAYSWSQKLSRSHWKRLIHTAFVYVVHRKCGLHMQIELLMRSLRFSRRWRFKSRSFWVLMTCSVAVGHKHWRGPCCLHLQGEGWRWR